MVTDEKAPKLTYTEERFRQLRDNAACLRELFDRPKEHDKSNVRVFRTVYLVGGQMVSAALILREGEQPAAQVTKRFSDSLVASQRLQGEGITAEDHVTFLGLDESEPRVPAWKQDKTVSGLYIMRDPIGRPLNSR